MYSWCMSRLNGGVNKPYATVCQRKANLPVLPNILAIKQLQWERAKTVLVQRGIGWFRALRICSHSQYMFTYSRLLSLRLPALTYYTALVGVYALTSGSASPPMILPGNDTHQLRYRNFCNCGYFCIMELYLQ